MATQPSVWHEDSAEPFGSSILSLKSEWCGHNVSSRSFKTKNITSFEKIENKLTGIFGSAGMDNDYSFSKILNLNKHIFIQYSW